MSLKASISGVRGIVGESLTPPIIFHYVMAFASIMKEGKILIGRDSRISGEVIANFVKSTLNSAGRDVVDIGIVPTPVVLFGVKENDFAGGIIITASHNPEQWNALKFVNSKGKFISPEEFSLLQQKYNERKFSFSTYKNLGRMSSDAEIVKFHRKKILDFIDKKSIENKNFKVALDTVNGAGGDSSIDLLQELGCKIKDINTEPTGIFAHPPEPTPKNLTELSELIKKEDIDVGFALDPDGDRLVIADEKGCVISEELTLALCVKHYLSNYEKTDVVINLSTSRVIEDVAKEYGCKVARVPTGEINVTEEMEKIGSTIGGEGNGGIIAYKINKCRDALVGIALILEMLAKTNKKLSEIIKQLPEYTLIKEKIEGENIDFAKVESSIKEIFKNEKIDTRDGIRVDFSDKWVLIRKSNTEPIVRIFAEAKTQSLAYELIEKVKNITQISTD